MTSISSNAVDDGRKRVLSKPLQLRARSEADGLTVPGGRFLVSFSVIVRATLSNQFGDFGLERAALC